VAFTGSIAFHPLIPRVTREFRETFPLVAVTLAEGNPAELIERIESDRLDAAFIRMSSAKPDGIIFHPLLEEQLVVALPEGHALDQGPARAVVCTENRVRIDLMNESPNVIGDDRAAILLIGVVHLAIQIEEPA
jgi:DNA-binding transcriptional LysR family regulator